MCVRHRNITAAIITLSRVKKRGAPLEKIKTTIPKENEAVQKEEEIILQKITTSSVQPIKRSRYPITIISLAALLICLLIILDKFFNIPIISGIIEKREITIESNRDSVDRGEEDIIANDNSSLQKTGKLVLFTFDHNIETAAKIYINSVYKGTLYDVQNGIDLPKGVYSIIVKWDEMNMQWNYNVEFTDQLIKKEIRIEKEKGRPIKGNR